MKMKIFRQCIKNLKFNEKYLNEDLFLGAMEMCWKCPIQSGSNAVLFVLISSSATKTEFRVQNRTF